MTPGARRPAPSRGGRRRGHAPNDEGRGKQSDGSRRPDGRRGRGDATRNGRKPSRSSVSLRSSPSAWSFVRPSLSGDRAGSPIGSGVGSGRSLPIARTSAPPGLWPGENPRAGDDELDRPTSCRRRSTSGNLLRPRVYPPVRRFGSRETVAAIRAGVRFLPSRPSARMPWDGPARRRLVTDRARATPGEGVGRTDLCDDPSSEPAAPSRIRREIEFHGPYLRAGVGLCKSPCAFDASPAWRNGSGVGFASRQPRERVNRRGRMV